MPSIRSTSDDAAGRTIVFSRGVERAIARSDHWRWVSTPRWSRTSRLFDRLRGDLDLPAPDVPGEDLQRLARGVGAQQRLRIEPAQRIAQQNPADRYDRQPGVVPHGGGGAELDDAIPPEPVERRRTSPAHACAASA